ncbi:FAD binding domain-containing protein [Rhodococcus sp. CX]|uniref:FAD binding domain-containing protein n=1 Tax=Rhodococcus sp. CX TaxID=2789880 RepID=UPI0018CE2CD9|nr:FAD binding domain-containing protein [Rhodococcus sp. CX]MBH0120812.1 FAD binding domain-containing protein [Rhodococcus sp. CX]
MDLHTVTAYRVARDRHDLAAGPGTAYVGGGTWLFSEPQPHLNRLVDLTGLEWPALTVTEDGLEIAATCTVEQIANLSGSETWPAAPLFRQCASALLASWKIWKRATVGGNLCLSFPAGAMISLVSALDGTVLIWSADGSDRRIPVVDFVTGIATNVLGAGDVVRSIHIPAPMLQARTAFRKIALSPLGRSGAVVIGRRDPDGAVALSVTAATERPYVLTFDRVPDARELEESLAERIPVSAYYTDAHGAADWRRAVTAVLAGEICEELS